MPKQLILNSSNYDQSGNKFIYNFPVRQRFVKGDTVGLSSISIYNSFFNISAAYGNNTLKFHLPAIFASGAGIYTGSNSSNSTYQIIRPTLANLYGTLLLNLTIPDGYYAIDDLNYFIQQQFILNNFYLINTATGNFTYFAEIVTNSTRYAGQLNFYALPITLTNNGADGKTNYAYPTFPLNTLSWQLPFHSQVPSVEFNAAFGSLIGFAAGSYPDPNNLAISIDTQVVSTRCPTISIVNSLILTCNLINNHGLSIPTTIFNSIPLTVKFGSQVTVNSSQIIYSDIAPNDYATIEIQIFDQNLNSLSLLDTDVLLTLSINQLQTI